MCALVPVIAALGFVNAPSVGAAQPTFMGLGHLPGAKGESISEAQAVSGDGSVVVGYGNSASSSGSTEAFIWTGQAGMIGLSTAGSALYPRAATGVSADGLSVAGYGEPPLGEGEGWRWTASDGLQGIGYLAGGGLQSGALAISGDGSTIVGFGSSSHNYGGEAFRWTAQTGMVGLGGLPGGFPGSSAWGVNADGSVVVGFGNGAAGGEAFRWTAATGMVGLGDLAGGSFASWAIGVNADGSAVIGVSASDRAPMGEAFRWTQAAGMIGLGDLPGGSFRSRANGISGDGSIIVGAATIQRPGGPPGEDEWVAFIWDEIHGIRNLRDLLVNDLGLDLTGWKLGVARAISADGTTIVGAGRNPLGQGEAWLARIPEPASGILLLTAISLAGVRRRP